MMVLKAQNTEFLLVILTAILIACGIFYVDRDILINDEWRYLKYILNDYNQWTQLGNLYNTEKGALLPAFKFLLGISATSEFSGFIHIRPLQLTGAIGYAVWVMIIAKTTYRCIDTQINSRRKDLTIFAIILLLSYPFMFSHSLHTLISFNKFCFFISILFCITMMHQAINNRFNVITIGAFALFLSLVGGIINIFMLLIALSFLIYIYLIRHRKSILWIYTAIVLVGVGFLAIQLNTEEMDIGRATTFFSSIKFLNSLAAWHITPVIDIYREPRRLGEGTQSFLLTLGYIVAITAFVQFARCAHSLLRCKMDHAIYPLFFFLLSWGCACAIWLGGGSNKPPFFVAQHRYVEMQIIGWLGIALSFMVTDRLHDRFGKLLSLVTLLLCTGIFLTGWAEFFKATYTNEKKVASVENFLKTDPSDQPCWKKIGFWRPLDDSYCEPLKIFARRKVFER